MKIPTDEFNRILSARGFTAAGPSAQEALERLVKQWVDMLMTNLGRVAPRGTKVSRRHFAALEKSLGPMIGALRSGVQSGGDYWQASE